MDLTPFLYRLRVTEAYNSGENWGQKEWDQVEAHANFFNNLGRAGRLMFAGRSQMKPGHFETILFSVVLAATVEDAEAILAADPLVTSGMYLAQLNPFKFTMLFPQNFPVVRDHSSSESNPSSK